MSQASKNSFWRRFRRNRGALFGLIVLMLVALLTLDNR